MALVSAKMVKKPDAGLSLKNIGFWPITSKLGDFCSIGSLNNDFLLHTGALDDPTQIYYIKYYVVPSSGACSKLVHGKRDEFIAVAAIESP